MKDRLIAFFWLVWFAINILVFALDTAVQVVRGNAGDMLFSLFTTYIMVAVLVAGLDTLIPRLLGRKP